MKNSNKTLTLSIYKKTKNSLDLSNPKHVLHVIATIGYHGETAAKSRVISLMRVHSNEKNLKLTDHFSLGAYRSLISAIEEDGTKLEFTANGEVIATLA